MAPDQDPSAERAGRGARRPLLVVSVHDGAVRTAPATQVWAQAPAGSGIPLTFLVVPGPWRGARFGHGGAVGELAA